MAIDDTYELNFQKLIDHSLNAIIVLRNKEIIYANDSALELVGIDNHFDILHVDFHTFLHPDYHDLCKERLRRVREELEIAQLSEQKLIKADGTEIDIEIMAVPYQHKEEALAQVTIRDISKRKQAEKKLYHAEKLSAIGEISTGVAHEIKNPLTAVKGFVQLLKTEHYHPYLDIVSKELDNAIATLTNLLQVAKPDLENEPSVSIHLTTELEALLSLFQDQFYRVKVETRFYHEEQSIIGKKNLLLKAFFNLVKNAFEAIEGDGQLLVEHFYKENAVYVKISDTGVGISQDKIKNLGTPFFSTKAEGTGMGLTQVYNTIHNHNGTIEVLSEVGKGTTFAIQLPCGN